MDVRSVFLNDFINKKIYVSQPLDFEDHLDSLKQAPRQWYDELNNFLLSQNYERGKVHKTLLFKKENLDIILVQIYVR